VADGDGEDEAVAGAGEDVVAVDIAPLVSTGWLAEVMGVPIDLFAAVPVVVVDVMAFAPVVMVDVVLIVMVAVVIVRMVLSDREGTGQGKGDSGDSKSSAKCVHGISSGGLDSRRGRWDGWEGVKRWVETGGGTPLPLGVVVSASG
jgi:uncharacterized membrane protein YgcG